MDSAETLGRASVSLSVFLSPLQKLLNTFQSERHYTDEKKDAALLAINNALIETKRYIEESGGAKCFDRKREYDLAGLWAEAATKARHANHDLAFTLQDKSLYWSGKLEWSRGEVLKRKIDLESIHEQVQELLKR
jgi:hypothetical protein